MNRQQNKHLLKIFSGPHIGAEILLQPGTYEIGRGQECDIVLQDEMIGDKHARITIDKDVISVSVIGQKPVLLEGVPILVQDEQSEVSLSEYETLTLGTTHLALGKPNGDWSKIRFPSLLRKADLDAPRAPRAEDNPPKPVGSMGWLDRLQKNLNGFLANVGINGLPVNKKAGANRKPVANNPAMQKFKQLLSRLSASRLLKYVQVFAAVLLGISLGLTPAVFSFTSVKVKNEPDYLLLETIESVLDSPEFSGVRAASITEGNVLIEGYVSNNADKLKLQSALQQIGLEATLKVRTGTQLKRSADTILKVLGFGHLQAQYQPHGKLDINGYSADKSAWLQARETLLKDIPGLEGIVDDGVQDIEARRSSLQKYIDKHKLDDKLVIKTGTDGELTVYGVLGPQELDEWRATLKQFQGKYGGMPVIRSKVHDTREVIELAIKSVRIGDVPYLVTDDGAKYLEGSVLPNGYMVKSILSDKIVLSRNSVEAVYYLGN